LLHKRTEDPYSGVLSKEWHSSLFGILFQFHFPSSFIEVNEVDVLHEVDHSAVSEKTKQTDESPEEVSAFSKRDTEDEEGKDQKTFKMNEDVLNSVVHIVVPFSITNITLYF